MKSRETKVEGRGRKSYPPVTDFERATSYCPRKAAPRGGPLYLAWRILDEARDYFRTSWVPSRKKHLIRPADTFSPSDAEKGCLMSEELADKLAHRAEAVFAHHPFMQRQFKSASGRAAILMFMRHWLAGVLAKERPALFRDLPESFKVGHPLPQSSGDASSPQCGGDAPVAFFQTPGKTTRQPATMASPAHFCDGASQPHPQPYAGQLWSSGLKARRSQSAATTDLRRSRPANRFVHGCELLPA
jgi:hypothetical protein